MPVCLLVCDTLHPTAPAFAIAIQWSGPRLLDQNSPPEDTSDSEDGDQGFRLSESPHLKGDYGRAEQGEAGVERGVGSGALGGIGGEPGQPVGEQFELLDWEVARNQERENSQNASGDADLLGLNQPESPPSNYDAAMNQFALDLKQVQSSANQHLQSSPSPTRLSPSTKQQNTPRTPVPPLGTR